MSARVSLNVRQRRLASALRRHRELSLLTADQVAQRVGWSASKVSRIENARVRLRTDDVQVLLDLYAVPSDLRTELLELAGEPVRKRWWDAYSDALSTELLTLISFEADAVAARSFEPMVVPGLLQTEAYARELFRILGVLSRLPPVMLERRIETRIARQKVLTQEKPLKLHVVLDESVLRRQIGDVPVMRGQLRHLFEVSDAPNVTVQILLLAQAHEALAIESFVMLEIPDFQPTLWVEHLFDSNLHLDDADRIYQYALIFDAVSKAACSAEDSRRLIERTAKDLWGVK